MGITSFEEHLQWNQQQTGCLNLQLSISQSLESLCLAFPPICEADDASVIIIPSALFRRKANLNL
ncbi:unnamed protein product [Musa textilis]